MTQNRLTHYSRCFSAPIITLFSGILLWCLILFIFTLNLIFLTSIKPLDPIKIAVLKNPNSIPIHTTLARLYWLNGYNQIALKEMNIIAQLNAKVQVLGISYPTSNILSDWQNDSVRKLSNYLYWKSVSDDKPDYISAKVQAAAWAITLGKTTEARALISQLKIVDPTNPEVNFLEKNLVKIN